MLNKIVYNRYQVPMFNDEELTGDIAVITNYHYSLDFNFFGKQISIPMFFGFTEIQVI